MDIKEIIDKQIKNKLKKTEMDKECHFRELGIDSLDIVDLVLSLENVLQIEFSDDELSMLKTLKDLYELCESRVLNEK